MKIAVITSGLAMALASACGDDGGGDDGNASASAGSTSDEPASTSMPSMSTGAPGTSTGMPGTTTEEPATSTGPEPSTGEAVCMTDVCATYGPAVPDVASAIVDQAAADPMFMDFFAPLVAQGQEAVDAFKMSLANFISDAYGCTKGAYTGPSMEEAHAGLGITQEEYDAFIALIAGVLADAGVPEEDINLCFAPPLVDPAFVATIVGQ